MKKYLCLLWGGVLLVGACQKTPGTPSVTLTAGESGQDRITFTVNSSNATSAAYIVLDEGEAIPSADEILENGTAVETGASSVTVDGLEPGYDFVIAAAAESGTLVSEVATLEMSTACYADVKAVDASIWYYGHQPNYLDKNLFLLQISDVEADGYDLRPTGAGKVIRFYLLTERDEEAESPVLTPGTYTCSGEIPEAGNFIVNAEDGYVSFYSEGSSDVTDEWNSATISDGTLTIGYEDGVYTIRTRLTLEGEEGLVVKGEFSGECPVEDLSDGVRYFYEDIENQKFDWMGLTIYESNGLGSFNATAGNCPLDESGYVAGAGYVMTFNLYTPAASYGDMAFEGTYTVKAEITEYSAYPGYIYDAMGMIMSAGNYITYYGENGASQYVGLITGGAIEISRNGETYTVKSVDLVTSTGCSVDFEYSGAINPVYDYRTQTSAAATSSAVPEVTLGLGEVWTPAR